MISSVIVATNGMISMERSKRDATLAWKGTMLTYSQGSVNHVLRIPQWSRVANVNSIPTLKSTKIG